MTQVIKSDGRMEGIGSVWVLDSSGRAKINAHLLDGLHADATGAADAHVVATDASGDATVGGLTAKGLRVLYSAKTISGGAITVTTSDVYIRVDTQGAAASDDLDTIGGGTDGQIIVLRCTSAVRSIVVKNGTGNIYCGADRTLNVKTDKLVLVFDAEAANTWSALAFMDNQ